MCSSRTVSKKGRVQRSLTLCSHRVVVASLKKSARAFLCRSVLQKSIDVVGNVSVLKLGAVALNRLTVLVDQELFEVPGDV